MVVAFFLESAIEVIRLLRWRPSSAPATDRANHLLVSDPQLLRCRRQRRIRRPQSETADERRRQQMRIDPADAASVQPPVADKCDDVVMRYHRRLMHLLVVGQQLFTPAFVADEQFAVHEVMPLTSSRLNSASSSVA